MRVAVRIHDSVTAEIGIGRLVNSEVPAVCPVRTTFLILHQNALVNPVPYKAALKMRIFINRLPLPD